MNLKEIREMINLMNENDLTEIEIEREGTKIKLKKSSAEMYEIAHKSNVGYKAETQTVSSEPDDNADSYPHGDRQAR